MNNYLLLFRNDKNEGPPPSAEQMQAAMQQWQDWIKGLAASGHFGGTNRLLSEGRTLKPGGISTDGPYAEAKEIIGGYVIVKAASLDEASELAKDCPNLTYGGYVEIRRVMDIDSDPKSPQFLQQIAVPA